MTTTMPGLRTIVSADKRQIELQPAHCRLAIGRLLILIILTLLWLFGAIFFGMAAIASDRLDQQIPSWAFGIIFLAFFLITGISCFTALGRETIALTDNELVVTNRVFFFTYRR